MRVTGQSWEACWNMRADAAMKAVQARANINRARGTPRRQSLAEMPAYESINHADGRRTVKFNSLDGLRAFLPRAPQKPAESMPAKE